MRKISIITVFFLFITSSVSANEVCDIVRGARIIAQDSKNTYLGEISNSYSSDSIFNEYGTYGSKYNEKSVFNSYGEFGSEYNQYSATNSYTSEPPMLIKDQKIAGYLSANKNIQASISPALLKALCAEEL
ncbi:hypothetical protein [Vibrio crassostreae]|uniref:hypothetical protein n=1 Tax=Vibrio crassostreae TaxID=246167 RepID=UPI001047A60F|nr:hypothetical protein [Vibrio crassostreae]TCW20218.1 hypothetical protein EDB48_104164 [Vibrio crassostreae]CAK3843974.1 conserved exported hypothetical protein [Vibrio crassostreae]